MSTLSSTWRFWLPRVLLIVAATLWIYWPALGGSFVWDDDWYITNNPLLHDTTGLWKFWYRPGSWVEYYPIHETLLWVQWQLWGSNTLGYHLTNVVLHIINALLVWHLLGKFGLRLAWLGGLLFAVHPVQVQAVAWISELKTDLSLPFFLLSMCSWIDYEQSKTKNDYQRALGLFLLAMLCKIAVAPFPLIILLYAWWKRGRIERSDLKESVPFFVISLVLGLTTIWAGNVYEESGHTHVFETPLGDVFTCFARAGSILAFYFSICFLPIDLAPVYLKWSTNPGLPVSYLPWLVLAAVLAWSWKKRLEWGRHVLLGLGFFGLTIAPFLGFHSVSYMKASWVELHLLYIPLIGLIGLVVAGLGNLDEKLPSSTRHFTIGVLALVIILMSWSARAYAGWFNSEETLWSRTLQREPQTWIAHFDLGCNFIGQGRYPEAIEELKKAIPLLPDYSDNYYNLGLALNKLGRYPEAQEQYRLALKLNPGDAKVYINLGDSLLQSGDLAGAIAQYEEAVKITPDDAALRYDLGSALIQSRNFPAAIEQLETAVKLNPGLSQAHENLGSALAQTGHLPEAIEHFEAAIAIDPGYVIARNNLGLALAQSGHISEAIEQFQQVLQIDPDNAAARQYLVKLQSIPQRTPGL